MSDNHEVWVPDIPFPSRRAVRRTLWIAAAVALFYLVAWVHDQFFYHARAALPPTARDIHLYFSPSYGIQGDYYDLLKAKISTNEFFAYVKKLKLSPLESDPDQLRGRFVAFRKPEVPWWNPSERMADIYYDANPRGSKVVLAKYEGGHVYFIESCGY